jgi:hypothetical protein
MPTEKDKGKHLGAVLERAAELAATPVRAATAERVGPSDSEMRDRVLKHLEPALERMRAKLRKYTPPGRTEPLSGAEVDAALEAHKRHALAAAGVPLELASSADPPVDVVPEASPPVVAVPPADETDHH